MTTRVPPHGLLSRIRSAVLIAWVEEVLWNTQRLDQLGCWGGTSRFHSIIFGRNKSKHVNTCPCWSKSILQLSIDYLHLLHGLYATSPAVSIRTCLKGQRQRSSKPRAKARYRLGHEFDLSGRTPWSPVSTMKENQYTLQMFKS